MVEDLGERRVAIVTGAGRGLGRSHALALARRGVTVVVNETGGDVRGDGKDERLAEKVVREIHECGGDAVADHNDVSTPDGSQSVIDATVERFGGVDALVNNAGILRDRSLAKMTVDDWDDVLRVHLTGSAYCTLAAWSALQKSPAGRVVFTSSAAGLYGQFGQANYAAAKMGMVGLVNVLKQEGAKYGVLVNAIAPLARTRMTDGLLPSSAAQGLGPEHVSPIVAYLTSAACTHTGLILEAAAGLVGRVQVVESDALELPDSHMDDVAISEVVEALCELPIGSPYDNADAALARFIEHASNPE